MSHPDTDIDSILAYNPVKIELALLQDEAWRKKAQELEVEENRYSKNLYIKSDVGFYWILSIFRGQKVIYKAYSSIEYIRMFVNEEPISKEITYYFFPKDNKRERVISISGSKYIEKLLQHYSKKNAHVWKAGKHLMHFDNKYYMYIDEYFPESAKIYESLESFEIDQNGEGRVLPEINESVLDLGLNMNKLASEIKVDLSKFSLSQNDLELISLKLYQYSKHGDVYDLYQPLCSLYFHSLKNSYIGEGRLMDGELLFEIQNKVININQTVLKTITNILTYEFNPRLYFRAIIEE
jgi:hypothetical protein